MEDPDDFDSYPRWNLEGVSLTIFCFYDDYSFVQSNPTAVHPLYTSDASWNSGINTNGLEGVLSIVSQSETQIPQPAVLLLRHLPKNGGAYLFGQDHPSWKPDVIISKKYASPRQFCVYPDLRKRTWRIRELRGREITVNGIPINAVSTKQSIALRYDCVNIIGFRNTVEYYEYKILIKPTWPDESVCLGSWKWRIPRAVQIMAPDLISTNTPPAVTRFSDVAFPPEFIVLERKLNAHLDIFYAQDLNTGVMLAAERFSSEQEAKEQFDMRKHLHPEHLLSPIAVRVTDHPYLLTSCPFDTASLADTILDEPLNDRTAYALLKALLSVLMYLFYHNIAGVAISSENILVATLSPEEPRFWLTGISSARHFRNAGLQERHYADVKKAMKLIEDNTHAPHYFKDPAVNHIFTESLHALKSTNLFAQDILTTFDNFTAGKAAFPFKSEFLTATFRIGKVNYKGESFFPAWGIAWIASALFAETKSGAKKAREKVLSIKPLITIPGHEEEPHLSLDEIKGILARLGKTVGTDFILPRRPDRRSRPEEQQAKQEESEEVFSAKIRITYHSTFKMWNLSQLLNAPMPEHSPPNLETFIIVCGDANCEGIYVTEEFFEMYSRPLKESPPMALMPMNSTGGYISQPNPKFGCKILADAALLGTATFDYFSRTIHYGNFSYSENDARRIFPAATFKGIYRVLSPHSSPSIAPTFPDSEQPENPKKRKREERIEYSTDTDTDTDTNTDNKKFTLFTRLLSRKRARSEREADSRTERWVHDQLSRKR
ncbi:hypothetical protein LOZ39_005814 [Ophidiomyces ophidiicola]|nr:hypothetical protein LOZ64_004863 [Ophidiomyces ophidiicola]KAI2000350.1 hypothetical protein LOZ50_006001 [Ophidiomyces ophidiicola]KAI2013736.1 hypothetical protein LOZ49_001806 [Ophidiomyces ophidiicola]KAI2014481.1 hypothetical protein LOZ46_005529 [Ophidiomyces ophidiicola]KAI2024216.1 hypothetical protein LOZ45_003685 [Ophidiomyces ophidiicola]